MKTTFVIEVHNKKNDKLISNKSFNSWKALEKEYIRTRRNWTRENWFEDNPNYIYVLDIYDKDPDKLIEDLVDTYQFNNLDDLNQFILKTDFCSNEDPNYDNCEEQKKEVKNG